MTEPARPRIARPGFSAPLPCETGIPLAEDRTGRSPLSRRLPFLLILVVAVPGAFLLRDQLDFAALAGHRAELLAFRDANYALAALAFTLAYIGIVAFSLPGATVATLTGGFLFGLFPGVLFNVTGATIGAVLIFLAARAGFGAGFANAVSERGGAAARLQAGLRDNEWSVLFLMRLVPALPFFLANLLPAFMGARLYPFAVTTFLGIIPGALVFTSVGAGLDEVIARGETPDLSVILAPEILLPILGLAALAALPLLIRLLRRKEA
ncbi:TVP38/TMEM64 family protein [Szabonella alba]|uniref:TVP38/TMEM64 family membrane protein n=1 Tax=Szabonella alba TaxID=2804194 RepID=A0A8K0VBB4_9RHOB|nr:VTT domain-containing protein [Szabonella alba]MBL4918773.1 TVP38/TMEM64 family protein [Szabonella alba]